VGSTEVTVVATDPHNNTDVDAFTVVVADNQDPVITVKHVNGVTETAVESNGTINAIFDPSICGAVVNYSVSAADNCTSSITPDFVSGLESGSTFPFGNTVVTYRAEDEHGNISYFRFTVNVGKATTVTTLTVTPLNQSTATAAYGNQPAQQYSDRIKLSVTITNGASSCSTGQAATSINFYIAGVLLNSQPIALASDGNGNLVAEAEFALLGNYATPCGTILKTVSAELLDKNTNYFNVADPSSKPLYILKEDADVDYTGSTFISTAYTSVDVLLTATIKDFMDNYPGDISNAKVKFVVTDYMNTLSIRHQSGWLNVNLSNPSVLTEGYAAYQ